MKITYLKVFFYIIIFNLCFATNSFARTTIKLVEVITSKERTQILRQLLDEFEAKNKDITVEVTSIPWGNALGKIIDMASRNDAPDVIEMPDRWLALFVGGGLLFNMEDKIANWPNGKTLEPKTMGLVRQVDGIYTIPYGLYLRAMFYNKQLLKQAGIEKPPYTMDEFMTAAAAISKLPEKSGYCLRGGSGGLNAWFMMAAAMNGTNHFFTEDGKSKINEAGAVKGLQFLIDMYQKGYAPKESINWGFDEVVSNFATGKCGFLDQDPDAINLILKNMDEEEFAVTTMPVGPSKKAFPTIGFAGWSISSHSKKPDEAWKLVSYLLSPKQNFKWLKEIGIVPIQQNIDETSYLKQEKFSGWYKEINEEAYQPTVMPLYLEQFANFESSTALFSSREALLGQRSAQELADLWAEFLTKEYAKWNLKK